MGRIAAFTQEQVFEAANKLAADGIEVSPNALRDHLGRGSFSTFMKHIDAWKKAQEDTPASVVFEMPESVKSAFAQCWQAAAAEAGKEIFSVKEKAEVDVRFAQRRTGEALEAIERLEAEAEADATRIEELESLLASQSVELAQVASMAATREAALSAASEQMAQRIQAQDAELVRVHEEVADLRNQLTEARKNLDAASARERVLIEDGATAKANVERLTAELKAQRTQGNEVIGKLEKSKQTLDAQLLALQSETKEMAAKLGLANGELEALRTRVVSQEHMIERFTPAIAQRNLDGRKTSQGNE